MLAAMLLDPDGAQPFPAAFAPDQISALESVLPIGGNSNSP
jgi:hypothetical protein